MFKLIKHAFWLIRLYLIIKKESRKIKKGKKTQSIKIKMEKNEFRKKIKLNLGKK